MIKKIIFVKFYTFFLSTNRILSIWLVDHILKFKYTDFFEKSRHNQRQFLLLFFAFTIES